MTTRATIANCILSFCEMWPDKFGFGNEVRNIWHKVLEDKPDILVELAAAQWIAESKWAPTPADIRRLVCRLEIRGVHDSSQAWHWVQAYVRRVGQNEGAPRDHLADREIDAVEAAGGFWELRHGDLPQAFRKRFETAYNASVDRDIEKLMDLPATRQVKRENGPALPSPIDSIPRLEESHEMGADPEEGE